VEILSSKKEPIDSRNLCAQKSLSYMASCYVVYIQHVALKGLNRYFRF